MNNNTEEEIWKPIKDFDGYFVSNLGRVKSAERVIMRSNGMKQTIYGRMIKISYDHDGYPKVSMNKDKKRHTRRIHRLVAQAFIPSIHNKTEVNHISGVKKDCSVGNLEWCNRSENMLHAHENDLKKQTVMVGDEARYRKLSSVQVKEICKMYETGNYTQLYIAGIYGVSRGTIHQIVRNKIWGSLDNRKRSEVCRRSKLTNGERKEIYDLYEKGVYSQRELGEIYGITQTSVSSSIRRTKRKMKKTLEDIAL
jgi:hypothetical protein